MNLYDSSISYLSLGDRKAAGMHLLSQGVAFGQNIYASRYMGNLRMELQDSANNLGNVADNADMTFVISPEHAFSYSPLV
jgi:hypothetical protein